MTAPPGYRCALCGRTSYHPDDLANRYCSCCGSEDGILPKDCEHRRSDLAFASSGVDRIQDECDRQMILLSLAVLAAERPGWRDAIGRIADPPEAGRAIFEAVLKLRVAERVVAGGST